MIFIASNGRLGAGSHLRNSLGCNPPRFASCLECLPWSSEASRGGPVLYELTSPGVSQVLIRLNAQPVALWRQFSSPASTCFSLRTTKLAALATPTLLRSLSQNCLCAADAPPHCCPWAHIARVQVRARESHEAFSSNGSFCLVNANGRAARLREVRGGTANWTCEAKINLEISNCQKISHRQLVHRKFG